MGLDITAYRKLSEADGVILDDGEPVDSVTHEYRDDAVIFWVNDDFLGREIPIKHQKPYASEGERFGFAAGSYSGYGYWRDELARMAGYPATAPEPGGNYGHKYALGAFSAKGGPFWELINFSDCEGVIGSVVAAKLAKDFADHDEQAKQFATGHTRFYEKYSEWRKAFEIAADSGAVSFH